MNIQSRVARSFFVLVLLTAVALLIDSDPAVASPTNILTVNTTSDADNGGCGIAPCSLREAISDANASPGTDAIEFSLPACPVSCSISPTSNLPFVTGDDTTIDGTTQNGWSGDPIVTIDGSLLSPGDWGLNINANRVVVRGLVVRGIPGDGIRIGQLAGVPLSEVTIEDSFVFGSGGSGITDAFGNGGSVGLVVRDSTVQSSDSFGIRAIGDDAAIFGTDVIDSGAQGIVVGEDAIVENSAVTGSFFDGIFTLAPGAVIQDNVVTGNGFGGGGVVDAGVRIVSNSFVFGNTISGNNGPGVRVAGDQVVVGGPLPEAQNTITNNGGSGVQVEDLAPNPTGGQIVGNNMRANGLLGIDNLANGEVEGDVTPNDPADADDGPNDLLNSPVLSDVVSGSLSYTVSLNSAPHRQFSIVLYANDECDPSGHGEGDTLLGSVGFTTNAQGDASMSFESPTLDVPPGKFLTATTFDGAARLTSEFSECVEVLPPATPTPTPTPTPDPPASTTPGPGETGTPTPTPSPTSGPEGLLQGDNDCDGDADSVDALKGLQHVAAIDFSQEPGCPALGGAIPAGDSPDIFGDVDCDGDVDSVDGLKVLRFVAALPVSQNEPCVDIGQAF